MVNNIHLRVLDSPTAPRFARALHKAMGLPGKVVQAQMRPWKDGEHYYRPVGPTLRGRTVVLPWTVNLDTEERPYNVAESIAGLGVAVDACARMRVREVIIAMPHLDDPSGEILHDFVDRFGVYGDKVVLMRLDPEKPEKESGLADAELVAGGALVSGKVVRTLRRERHPISAVPQLAEILKASIHPPKFVIGAREYREKTVEFAHALFGRSTANNTVIAFMNFGQTRRGRALELRRANLPGDECVVFLPRATNPAPVRRIGNRLRDWGMHQVHLAVIHPAFLPGSEIVFARGNPFDSLFTVQSFEDPDIHRTARDLFNIQNVLSPAEIFARAIQKHVSGS